MPRFVGNDIVRQAGIDPLGLGAAVVELQRLALPVIVRVFTVPGMRHDNQSIAGKSPWDAPAKGTRVLEIVQDLLNDRPDVYLAELWAIVLSRHPSRRYVLTFRRRQDPGPAMRIPTGLRALPGFCCRQSPLRQREHWSDRRSRVVSPIDLDRLWHQPCVNLRRCWILQVNPDGTVRPRSLRLFSYSKARWQA